MRHYRKTAFFISKSGIFSGKLHILLFRSPERTAGIQFGLSLLKECREVWVFGEIMSEGMCMEIAEADHAGIPIRYFTKQNGEFVERSSL